MALLPQSSHGSGACPIFQSRTMQESTLFDVLNWSFLARNGSSESFHSVQPMLSDNFSSGTDRYPQVGESATTGKFIFQKCHGRISEMGLNSISYSSETGNSFQWASRRLGQDKLQEGNSFFAKRVRPVGRSPGICSPQPLGPRKSP